MTWFSIVDHKEPHCASPRHSVAHTAPALRSQCPRKFEYQPPRVRAGPMIEKYVMQIVEAAEAIGVREFGVVAEVEVIKVDIFDQQEVLGKTVYSASLSEFDHSSCTLE